MNTPISVVIITKNEEKNIGRCLESVKTVADEIVVVDSLSTDATKSICEQYNVKFIEQEFLGYIEQKNFALSKATHQWVLSLDADEALDAELTKSILKIKKEITPNTAYKMNRLTNFCGKWIKHGRWYPDQKIRLFNKVNGYWGGENPHDQVLFHQPENVIHLKGDLFHYSYYSLEQYINQINKFSSIQAEGLYKRGKKSSIFKIYFNPLIAFLRAYIFKRGFLDGYRGLIIAFGIAYTTMLKYSKLDLLINKAEKV